MVDVHEEGIVLVVNDDPALQTALQTALQARGYGLIAASTSQEVTNMIAEQNVVAAFVDLSRAAPRGAEQLRAIHSADAGIQCVALADAGATEAAAADADAYEVLAKPADTQSLLRTIIHAARHTKLLRLRQDSDTMLVRRTEELTASLQALRDAQERLDRTSNAALLGQLAEGLRHELGNALTVIRLNMSLITYYRDDLGRFVRHMDSLEEGVRSIERIALALRDFPSAEHDGGERLDLAQIIRHAAGQAQQNYEVSVDVLRLDLVENAPVRGGFFQLVRAFEALLENAFEAILHSNPPTPQIVVTLRSDGKRWQVSIQDNGTGLTPEALAHALEPGFTTKVDRGFMRGLGLGLFVADTIVAQHGGLMRLSNVPGGGTRVEVDLPQADQTPQSSP